MVGIIKKYGYKKLTLALSDFLSTLTAFLLTMYITSYGSMVSSNFYYLNAEKMFVFVFASFLIIPVFRYYQLYKHKYFLKAGEQAMLILKGLLITSIVIIILLFMIKTKYTLQDSRLQVILYFNFSFIFLLISRIIVLRNAFAANLLSTNLHKFLSRRAIAIGAGNLGHLFAQTVKSKHHYNIDLLGFIDDDPARTGTMYYGLEILSTSKNLVQFTEDNRVDEIYITIQKIPTTELLKLIEKCKLTNCHVNLVSDHFDIISKKWDDTEFQDLKIISISSNTSPLYSEKFKRFFDIFVSLLLIIILSPLGLIFSLLIKLTSPGPVFYKTKVIGKDGKSFYWYKFRTMKKDSDETLHRQHLTKLISENNPNAKLKNDPRITAIGSYLRKFSLDELPQLFNVLKGDMSIVGPRPCLPYEYEVFKDWHKLRYKVIPGITGLAQIIARNRDDVSFNDTVILDLYYADNQSLWLDIKILFKTVPIMILGKGGV